MAAQRWTLQGLYQDRKSDIGTDTITTTEGRRRATPFSEDESLEIDTSVVNEAFLQRFRGGIIDTNKYSDTVDRNTA